MFSRLFPSLVALLSPFAAVVLVLAALNEMHSPSGTQLTVSSCLLNLLCCFFPVLGTHIFHRDEPTLVQSDLSACHAPMEHPHPAFLETYVSLHNN
jgi:hypothetical protein